MLEQQSSAERLLTLQAFYSQISLFNFSPNVKDIHTAKSYTLSIDIIC